MALGMYYIGFQQKCFFLCWFYMTFTAEEFAWPAGCSAALSWTCAWWVTIHAWSALDEQCRASRCNRLSGCGRTNHEVSTDNEGKVAALLGNFLILATWLLFLLQVPASSFENVGPTEHSLTSYLPDLCGPQGNVVAKPEACWLVERFWLSDAPLPAIQSATCVVHLGWVLWTWSGVCSQWGWPQDTWKLKLLISFQTLWINFHRCDHWLQTHRTGHSAEDWAGLQHHWLGRTHAIWWHALGICQSNSRCGASA